MIGGVTGMAMLAVVAAVGADRKAALEDNTIDSIVESYVPPWRPPRGELAGIVVLLDPAWHDAADSAGRSGNDSTLLAAGYLYHLVRYADGGPVLTRGDDRPMPLARDEGADVALRRMAAEVGAHLLVRIEPGRATGAKDAGGAPSVCAVGSNALSAGLADALARGLGVKRGPTSEASRAIGVPMVTVRLAAPADRDAAGREASSQRHVAEALYRGLAVFVREHRDAIEADRRARWPDVSTTRPASVAPMNTDGQSIERKARAIWPQGDLPIERAAWFAAMWREVAMSDRTIVYFEPEIVVEGGRVIVRGATNVAVVRDTLPAALRAVGVADVRNEMRLLPEQGALNGRWFGACVAPNARTFQRPSEQSGAQTQLVWGEPVFLLDRADGYVLVQAGDGYWGWVRADAVHTVDRDAFARYVSVPIEGVLLRDVDIPAGRIRRGTRLPVAESSDTHVTLAGPGGERVDLPAADVRRVDPSASAERTIRAALALLDRPYIFGGVSTTGLDCSGLVCNAAAQVGVTMPRDAAQQLPAGRLVATRWFHDTIRPGDRLYFVNPTGKVFHTAIAIDADRFVHTVPPAVQISSIRPGDRLYDEGLAMQLFVVKRP